MGTGNLVGRQARIDGFLSTPLLAAKFIAEETLIG
jgi:hypothetical protein